MSQFIFAFLMTLIAGLATGIGAGLAFFTKKENAFFLSASLGFSAGVMLYVSFMEILPSAAELLQSRYHFLLPVGFFIGMLLIAFIDMMVPKDENPHEFFHTSQELKHLRRSKLLRIGLMAACAVAIHNFPEGFATFISLMQDKTIGISVVIAIALHNIPEGIAVSMPIYYATHSRKKAFWYSFASGFAEPIGAAIGYLILRPFLSQEVLATVFAATAGIMVYISLDELLPAAREYGKNHLTIWGTIIGMMFMAFVLEVVH